VWVEKVDKDLLPAPPYFQRMKKINVAGAPLLNTLKTSKWEKGTASPQLDSLFLLDARLPDSFAMSHIKGSINIPITPTFAQWAGWMLPEKGPIGLIVENPHAATELIDLLRLMGFDQEIWIIHFAEIENSNLTFATFPMMDVHALAKQQPSFESLYLVDVRTQEEWSSGHIPGSHHIELSALDKSYGKLPKNKPIALICRSGQRASLAASMLEKLGFPVVNIQGGMEAWTHSGLPTKKEKI
jgi:hydroxyacylglutathione hydrolase